MLQIGKRRGKADGATASVEAEFDAQTPDVGRSQASREFQSSVAAPTVDSFRRWLQNILLLVVIAILGLTINNMMPLKQAQLMVLEVNAATGDRKLSKDVAVRAEEYKPGQAIIDRELMTFVSALYGLNADAPKVVEEQLAVAYSTYARDKAAAQVREFITKEDPYQRMAKIPGLVRTVTKKTISHRGDAPIAMFRFSTSERIRGQADPIIRNYAMQVTYVIRPPKDEAEIDRNPLGFYITHIDTQEERS